jgi:hypothetical protein
MRSIEPINPYAAPSRLAAEWRINIWTAENIVRGVLCSGKCFVRGRDPSDMMVRDITEDIAAALLKEPRAGLIPWGFADVEMDWRGLLKHGRYLVPSWVKVRSENARPRKRPGPKPGTLRRYDDADRALFSDLERLVKDGGLSKTAAAKRLAELGRIAGSGTVDSKARRLLKLYQEK